MDWSKCLDVESRPGVVSGAYVVKGTRVPVAAVIDNSEDGFTAEQIVMDIYPTAPVERVRRIIELPGGMTRILLDENIPGGLRKLLTGYDVRLAAEMGLAGVSNGELLAAAERLGFEALITADGNLRYQQNLTGRSIAIVALGTNHWRTISRNPTPIIEALDRCGPGRFIEVEYPRLAPRPRKTPSS